MIIRLPDGSNSGGSGGGGAPSGSAGGSLTGTYPNPTIATIPSGATATTQTAADGSTKVATTAYVDTADALKANLASPTFSGTPSLPTGTTATTQSAADSSTKLATTAFTTTADNLKANLAGPTFTGSVTIPTPAVDDSSTLAASTSFVMTRMLGRGAKMDRTSASRFASASGGVAAYSESMPMYIRATVAMTSQTMFFALCPVEPGQVIANQIVHVSATGVTWGSNNDGHWWMALYSTDLGANSRLRVTSDLGHTGLAALAVEDRAFTSSYTVPAGVYEVYAAFVVYTGTGGAPATCSLIGSTGGVGDYGAEVTGALRAAGKLDTNITTGGPPSTPAAAADVGVFYRAVLH